MPEMTPWEAYKLEADARIAREEERRMKILHSSRGRLGCALTLLVLAAAAWLLFHWLNRHEDFIRPDPNADARWYRSASAGTP